MHSAAGSLDFRGILITDPGHMMKRITSEISLMYKLLRALEGHYGTVQAGQRSHQALDLKGLGKSSRMQVTQKVATWDRTAIATNAKCH